MGVLQVMMSAYGFTKSKFLGVESVTNNWAITANYMICSQFTATQTGYIDEIRTTPAGTGNFKFGVYSDKTGNLVGDLLSQGSSVAGTNGVLLKGTIPKTYIVSGQKYWLTCNEDVNFSLQGQTSGGMLNYGALTFASTFPNPFTQGSGGYVGYTSLQVGYGIPTGIQYAQFNSNDRSANLSFSSNNLIATVASSTAGMARSDISKSSGKWYWEISGFVSSSGGRVSGIAKSTAALTNYPGIDVNGWEYDGVDGKIYNNGVGTGTNATYLTSDIIGVALDMDTGVCTFYKNGVAQPTTITGLTGAIYAAYGSNNVAGVRSATLNFGQTAFTYPAPSGFNSGLYI